MNEGTAQPQLLLHSARKLARRAIRERIKPSGCQQTVDPAVPFRTIEAEKPREERQVLAHAERHVEVLPETLGHVGDAPEDAGPVCGAAQRSAQNLDVTVLQPTRTRDQAHEC